MSSYGKENKNLPIPLRWLSKWRVSKALQQYTCNTCGNTVGCSTYNIFEEIFSDTLFGTILFLESDLGF